MGASVCMSCYPMTGAEARRAAIPTTLSGAIGIGAAISRSDDPCAPIDRLVAALRVHDYYKDAEVIFRGKITGLERDTSKGDRTSDGSGNSVSVRVEPGGRSSFINKTNNIT